MLFNFLTKTHSGFKKPKTQPKPKMVFNNSISFPKQNGFQKHNPKHKIVSKNTKPNPKPKNVFQKLYLIQRTQNPTKIQNCFQIHKTQHNTQPKPNEITITFSITQFTHQITKQNPKHKMVSKNTKQNPKPKQNPTKTQHDTQPKLNENTITFSITQFTHQNTTQNPLLLNSCNV